MKRIEKMIPSAIASVTDCAIAKKNKDEYEVDGEFKGYISSLGASIISAGLLPTMIFFSNKGGSKADKPAIIKAIEYILKKNSFLGNTERLLEKIATLVRNNNNAELARLTELIADAAIALKLAIRTFPEKR
jgi:CRISPR type III-B/RAMP module-associated protein Cmr5